MKPECPAKKGSPGSGKILKSGNSFVQLLREGRMERVKFLVGIIKKVVIKNNYK